MYSTAVYVLEAVVDVSAQPFICGARTQATTVAAKTAAAAARQPTNNNGQRSIAGCGDDDGYGCVCFVRVFAYVPTRIVRGAISAQGGSSVMCVFMLVYSRHAYYRF